MSLCSHWGPDIYDQTGAQEVVQPLQHHYSFSDCVNVDTIVLVYNDTVYSGYLHIFVWAHMNKKEKYDRVWENRAHCIILKLAMGAVPSPSHPSNTLCRYS